MSIIFELETAEGGTTQTRYGPDPLHTRMQTLPDLLDTHDWDELVELKTDLQERVEDWEDVYGVNSRDNLRDLAADAETADQTRKIKKTANDWGYARYRLDLISDAIKNYDRYTQYDTPASA